MLPADVQTEVRRTAQVTAYRREKLIEHLTRAAEAYNRHRYEESLRLASTVSEVVPGVAAVRELAGIAAYRAERWPIARTHLRAYFELSGDPEHQPLVMDCERATRRVRAVETTYAATMTAEPTPDVAAEARIVLASTYADVRRFQDAIELLEAAGASKKLRNPSFRHVRLWYTLGDVLDRAGDRIGAREMFARVALADPDAYDVSARLEDLGFEKPSKNRKRRRDPVSIKKTAP